MVDFEVHIMYLRYLNDNSKLYLFALFLINTIKYVNIKKKFWKIIKLKKNFEIGLLFTFMVIQ